MVAAIFNLVLKGLIRLRCHDIPVDMPGPKVLLGRLGEPSDDERQQWLGVAGSDDWLCPWNGKRPEPAQHIFGTKHTHAVVAPTDCSSSNHVCAPSPLGVLDRANRAPCFALLMASRRDHDVITDCNKDSNFRPATTACPCRSVRINWRLCVMERPTVRASCGPCTAVTGCPWISSAWCRGL